MKNNNLSAKFQKDSLMFLIILGLWFILIFYFNPKILINIRSNEFLIPRLSVVCFVFFLDLFWLYGIYHLTISLFSYFCRTPKVGADNLISPHPKVAILYTTMNDFKEGALLSCISQDYDNFDVYILDDSTDEKIKSKIDEFIISRPQHLFIIRRGSSEDFKAGNLNNALARIRGKYEYFAVSDADGILPEDFIKSLLPYFSLDKSIAFVQANQRSDPKQKGPFSKDLSYNTDLHWKCYLPAKNYFGFVMFYGHGALIRTDVWNEAGGFPDTITEDLAFSSIIREKGYRGIFVDSVICYEEFPENYLKFRKRNERWVKGTTEYLIRWFPSLCRSNKVFWFEKLDILLSAGVLLMAVPFFLFLFIAGFAIPFSMENFGLKVPFVNDFTLLSYSIPSCVPIIRYKLDWTKEFFVVMSITAFAQLIPAVIALINKPVKMFRYCAQFTFVCLSMIVDSAISMLSFLLTKRSYFPVTGSRDILLKLESGVINLFEVIFALFLCFIMLKTSNIWLFGISFSLLMNSLIYRFRWDSPVTYFLIHLPFSVILFLLLISIVFLK